MLTGKGGRILADGEGEQGERGFAALRPASLRYEKLREKLGSSENRWSQLTDVSLFLELEEKLGLIGKITLCFLCPGNSGRVAQFSSSGVSSARSCQFCFAKSLYVFFALATAEELCTFSSAGDELLGAQVGFVSRNLNLFRNGIGFDCL